MSTAAAKRYLYSHFNNTPSNSSIHLNSSSPSSVISSHHRASLITSTNDDICSSIIPQVDLPVTIIASASASPITASPLASSPQPINDHQPIEPTACTPLTSSNNESCAAKAEQGLLKMEQDHRDGGDASAAIDLVKRPSSHSRHVPVIASTAGYNLSANNQSVASSTGRVTDSNSSASQESQSIAGAGAVEVQPSSTAHLYSPVTTDNDSEPNVTVCDSLMSASRAQQQSSQSPSTSTSSTAASSSLTGVSASAEAATSSDRHSESSDYGSLAGSKSSKDRESPFSSPDEGIDMEDVEVEFKNSAQSKDFLLKRISNDLEYSSHLSLKRRRKENAHLQDILSSRHDSHKDLVDICNKNEIFAHEPTTPIGGKGGVRDDSSMLKQNANGYRRTLYQCTWPACSYTCMACHLIEQHVRVEHLGRSQTDPIDNEDSDREEEFYYNEMEIEEHSAGTPPPAHSAFSSTASSASSSSSSAVSSAISPLSPTTPPSPTGNPASVPESVAVSLATSSPSDLVTRTATITSTAHCSAPASPPPPSPVIYRPSPLVASQASSHYRLINSQLLAATITNADHQMMASHKFASDVPMDLSPRSKQATTVVPVNSTVVTAGTDQSKSVSPFTSPLLLVSSAAPSVVTPISPVSSPVLSTVPFNAIYPHHRPLAELTASAASLIQQKLFHQFSFNAASTSPSSLSSHSSHSSASSAYFSSSPTSSTKSWSHLDEIMMNNAAVARSVANEAKLASQLSPAVASSSQPDPSVVTHSVSHLLSHDPSPASFNDRGVVVLNKSNVIKFGLRKDHSQPQGKPLDLHTHPKQSVHSISGAHLGLPDIKPILATVTSSNPSGAAILPLPLTSTLAHSAMNGTKAVVNGALGLNANGIPNAPRRRGRPPGSTNKKKKLQQQLQQQQQLIMSLMPTSGQLNPTALQTMVGHPFITSAGLLAPTGDPLANHLSCSQFAAAFAAVSAQSAANAIGLKPPGTGRKPRGEARKCRKVYGMDNRDMWCTQCKWKKACSRFTEP